MPKLLSRKEVIRIAARMTAEYGLPPPKIVSDTYYGTSPLGVKVEIVRLTTVRVWQKLSWPTRNTKTKVKEFYALYHEEALVKLQQELAKFNDIAQVAEQFREKYSMQEANDIIDNILRNE